MVWLDTYILTYYIYIYTDFIFFSWYWGKNGRLKGGQECINTNIFSEFLFHFPNMIKSASCKNPAKNFFLILGNMKCGEEKGERMHTPTMAHRSQVCLNDWSPKIRTRTTTNVQEALNLPRHCSVVFPVKYPIIGHSH